MFYCSSYIFLSFRCLYHWSILETYDILKEKNYSIYNHLNWHFDKILKSIKRKISPKERFHCPWTIVISREIHFPIYLEFYGAIKDYKTAFGRSITVKRDKKGVIEVITISFCHKGALQLHLKEVSNKSEGAVRSYFHKQLRFDNIGDIIVSEEQPTTFVYKRSTETLEISMKYEIKNRYGIVC